MSATWNLLFEVNNYIAGCDQGRTLQNYNLAVLPNVATTWSFMSIAKLFDEILNMIQGLMSNFLVLKKISMLTVKELQTLDKSINTFSRSVKPIFNLQIQPKSIVLPLTSANIQSIQAYVTMTWFGDGKLWRNEDHISSVQDLNIQQPSSILFYV